MGGGLLQLVAYGAQDVYLTGNPQITFFKVVYRRHTNFAIETQEQDFIGNPDFGNKVNCIVPRNGDLIHKIVIQTTIPQLNKNATTDRWVNYCNNIGHALVEEVSIEIGGQLIDKQYSTWMDILDEISSTTNNQEILYKYNTEKSLQNTNNNIEKKVYIPLKFWFCNNPGLALPLIALQYHEVNIIVNFRSINKLIKSDAVFNPSSSISMGQTNLLIDYIYLDTDERRRFAQVSHEYLIEQVQFTGVDSISSNTSNKISDLDFNHPIKSLHWVFNNNSYITANTQTGNNHFKYEDNNNAPFKNVVLQFNGQERFSVQPEKYFRVLQHYNHFNNIPSKYIYSYSFGLKPLEHQPSGTCNFSRIDNAVMKFDFDSANSSNKQLSIYAVNYNVLRIMSGMGGLAYSN